MNPIIVTKDSFKVMGMKITCEESKLGTEMPKLWTSFIEKKNEILNKCNNNLMDICLERIDKNYTQIICTEVSNFDFVPQNMVGITIPSQKYICLKHEGPEENIWKSFAYMQKWAEENNYEIDPLDFKMDISEPGSGGHELYIKIN